MVHIVKFVSCPDSIALTFELLSVTCVAYAVEVRTPNNIMPFGCFFFCQFAVKLHYCNPKT